MLGNDLFCLDGHVHIKPGHSCAELALCHWECVCLQACMSVHMRICECYAWTMCVILASVCVSVFEKCRGQTVASLLRFRGMIASD